ncbi:hypothetical protein ACFSTD_08900 [Novosphingobium colocasiae]
MFFNKQRLEERTVIAVHGRLRFDGRDEPVTLANASPRGVLALLDTPPKRGTRVAIEIGGSILNGQVRWSGANRCGIALGGSISVADLLEGQAVPVTFVTERDSALGNPGIFRAAVSDGPPGLSRSTGPVAGRCRRQRCLRDQPPCPGGTFARCAASGAAGWACSLKGITACICSLI